MLNNVFFSEKEIDALIKRINNVDLKVQINNIQLLYTDFLRLKPEGYLNDDVINAFMSLLQQKHEKNYYFDTKFMFEYENYGLKKINQKIIDSSETLFIPILNYKKNSHWILIVVDKKKKIMTCFDSCIKKKSKNYAEKYLNLVREFLGGQQWTMFFDEKTPQQNNKYDCGMYVCAIMDCLSEKKPLTFSPEEITNWRYEMMQLFFL